MRTVPVLLTYDIHVHGVHSAGEVEGYLQHTLLMHDELGVKASFFFPAEAARGMKDTVRALLRGGHEIGCHGLTHRKEYYNTMSPVVQEAKLRQATLEIEDVIGRRVTFFRAPTFKVSGTTLRILEELGYDVDLSVNSQRLGLFSSDVWNVSWMVAPRTPYHPDLERPWRKGKSSLWEIPLSCFLLPFMSHTGQAFGLGFMKTFFRALYVESIVSSKPIVYMAHPEDLCPSARLLRAPVQWRDLIPTRHHGFRFRHWFYNTDAVKVAELTRSLLEYIGAARKVRFLTVSDYVVELNRSESRSLSVAPQVREQRGEVPSVGHRGRRAD